MKIKVISDKIVSRQVHRQRRLEVGNCFIRESCINGVMTDQEWSIKGGFEKSHPDAYEPKSMRFNYFDDISFLNSKYCCHSDNFYQQLPDATWVKDWTTFKGFNHVLCIRLNFDGNIYRIDKPHPIKLWRYFDYITSFDSTEYDLKKVASILKRKSWIRNIQIVDIPYYNRKNICDDERAVEFEYKLSCKKELDEKLKKEDLFKNHYFGIG